MKLLLVWIIYISVAIYWLKLIIIENEKSYGVDFKVENKIELGHQVIQKHKTEISGLDKYFRGKSNAYGWADIRVTTNTYMTTKVGDVIYFDMNFKEIQDSFRKNVRSDSIFLNDAGAIITLTLLFISLLFWTLVSFED